MEHAELSKRYTGSVAEGYDTRRTDVDKWQKEQVAVRQLLERLPAGTTLLDIPVGTGRFIEMYKEFGLKPEGRDVSREMLAQSAKKIEQFALEMPLGFSDVTRIEAEDGSFDCTLCIRLLNWLPFERFQRAMGELSRVSRKTIIMGVRNYTTLSDLKPLSSADNFIRTLRQVKRRIGGAGGLVFHEHRQVTQTFHDLNLDVVERILIENRADGTDYYIYLLEKRG